MIDQIFKIFLIEVNTNPCLEFSCYLWRGLISSIIDNTIRQKYNFRICIDPIFPPPKFTFSNVNKHAYIP